METEEQRKPNWGRKGQGEGREKQGRREGENRELAMRRINEKWQKNTKQVLVPVLIPITCI